MAGECVVFENAILQFAGPWWILSNFAAYEVVIDGQKYSTVEHYFQAMKAVSDVDRTRIQLADTPDQAKRIGRSVPRIPEWNKVRMGLMRRGLAAKFTTSSEPGQKLLSTGMAILAEGNDWGDDEWGICEGRGENVLGVLLMERRGVLRSELDASI